MNALARFSTTARINCPAKVGRVGKKQGVKGTWRQRLNLACNLFGKQSFPYGEQVLKQSQAKVTAPKIQNVGFISHDNAFALSVAPVVRDYFPPLTDAMTHKVMRIAADRILKKNNSEQLSTPVTYFDAPAHLTDNEAFEWVDKVNSTSKAA